MKRIMVVDDSSTVRMMLKFALDGSGYEVLEVEDGLAALEILDKLQRDAVAMIITDLHMPRLDGIELIRKVRSHPEHCFLPIILLTGSDEARVRQGYQAGASAWVAKPFGVKQILKTVRSILDSGCCENSQARNAGA